MVGAGGMSRCEYVVISEGDFRMCKDGARLGARRTWTDIFLSSLLSMGGLEIDKDANARDT
jgi:hypothetical protein